MLSPFIFLQCKRPIKVAENIIIRELLDNIFSARLLHDELKIVNKVRPTALLSNVITFHNTR